MQGKELQRARRWVALGTKRKEGALQIQTVGEYKYIYKTNTNRGQKGGGMCGVSVSVSLCLFVTK